MVQLHEVYGKNKNSHGSSDLGTLRVKWLIDETKEKTNDS